MKNHYWPIKKQSSNYFWYSCSNSFGIVGSWNLWNECKLSSIFKRGCPKSHENDLGLLLSQFVVIEYFDESPDSGA